MSTEIGIDKVSLDLAVMTLNSLVEQVGLLDRRLRAMLDYAEKKAPVSEEAKEVQRRRSWAYMHQNEFPGKTLKELMEMAPERSRSAHGRKSTSTLMKEKRRRNAWAWENQHKHPGKTIPELMEIAPDR